MKYVLTCYLTGALVFGITLSQFSIQQSWNNGNDAIGWVIAGALWPVFVPIMLYKTIDKGIRDFNEYEK